MGCYFCHERTYLCIPTTATPTNPMHTPQNTTADNRSYIVPTHPPSV